MDGLSGSFGALHHAISSGLAAEVYTNLLHVKDTLWDLFACPGVSLATSYYSDSPQQHDAITLRPGSHAKTRANITEAIRRGIPLRAGIISLDDTQRADQARAELEAIGVRNIGFDHLRQVGRGVRSQVHALSQLCGNCGRGVAAISPEGDVWPCVFARWMTAGNVRQTPLADILASHAMTDAVALIPPKHSGHPAAPPCKPSDDCRPGTDCRPTWTAADADQPRCTTPQGCGPNVCLPNCTPSNWNCKPHKN
jgi:MoaA/NifB/PqqE/SkfB family radical SAM enzyme